MGTLEDAVNAVRAALEPSADPALREKAAALLRSLLAALETKPGGPPGGAPADVLGALIDKLRPLLPADAGQGVARLNIPLVALPPR